MSAQVVSLRGYVAYVEVYVEMLGVSLNVSVPFGPFDVQAEACRWLLAVEEGFAEVHAHDVDGLLSADVADVPDPFCSVHLGSGMVSENRFARHKDAGLFAPEKPSALIARLGSYALRMAQDAIAHTLVMSEQS